MRPADVETRLSWAALRLSTAKTREGRIAAWAELQRLHGLRSPLQVARMERKRGLR